MQLKQHLTHNKKLVLVGIVMLLVGAIGAGLITTDTTETDSEIETPSTPEPEPQATPEPTPTQTPEPEPEPQATPEPTPEPDTDQHVVEYEPIGGSDVVFYKIYVNDGIVCKLYADNPDGTLDCETNPEEALELLYDLDFYELHPDAPYPPGTNPDT